jgi:hypothetical protein
VASGKEQFLIVLGVCTHLSYVPFSNAGDFAIAV